ncbi:hypothetical protein M404DRAFT_9218 [Pisolithus tinctorius Marx 270]|uniref:Uncharacterized protein n=1 Tax=Pisolithus tinctorius Marx 270 TaxID=870435 RepID=A0A0C3K492_PISTI|nr:hypothetical protein M404DRAFT_9218 [Pisolithus tinctorius Marx 270]
MSRIMDLFEEEAKQSHTHQEVQRLMVEKKISEQAWVDAEKAQASAKEAEQNLQKMIEQRLVTAAKLKELFDDNHICVTQYTCPKTTCQVEVENKPIEIGLTGNMISAVNKLLGPPVNQVDPNPHLNKPNIWADIFYDSHEA